MNLIRVIGFVSIFLAISTLLIFGIEYEFPAFEYTRPSMEPPTGLVEADTSKIGVEVGRFLWSYRVIDLIGQAFVLFAAAACCVTLLRSDREKTG